MILDFIKNINWVDIIIILILVRIVYIGVQTGVVIELFKLLGVLVTSFLTLQYFTTLAHFFHQITKAPEPWMIPLAFLLLWGVLFFACKLLRDAIFLVFTIEAQSLVDKWGGALLSIVRFFLVASMTLFAFFLTGEKYIQSKVATSFSKKYAMNAAPGFYHGMWDGFFSKLFAGKKPNPAVADVLNRAGKR